MILTIAALTLIIGLVMYLVAKDGRIAEIGRLMFGIGLLVTLLNFGGLTALFPARR